jgi:adenylylsulfate kinase-like enzyme
VAQLVVITGPIAAGKNTVASLIADGLTALDRSAVLVDVDDVAAMVAGPGAAAAGLWFAAHQAHGALVGKWMQAAVDVVIAMGPIYTPREQAALLESRPEASAEHWVVINAPVAVTLARAQADPVAGCLANRGFMARLTGVSVSCCPRSLLLRPSTPSG